MLSPGNEQYTTCVNNLRKCLHRTDLTHYFRQNKFLSTAVANVKYYLDKVHKFIPHQFNTTLPNHCWGDDVELVVESSYISGHIGRTRYNSSRTDIDDQNLCIFRFSKKYKKRYVLPFSCIPEVFMTGFPKCGTTYMHTLITAHPAISEPIENEPFWWVRNEQFTDNNLKNALYMADYLTNFESLVEKLSETRLHNLVYGMDGTTSTLYSWPMFSGQNRLINVCLLPSVLPVVLPKIKFIVMMRNPVTYLYSHFWFSCTMDGKPVSLEMKLKGPDVFHDRVLQVIASFHACIAEFPLAKCGQITEHFNRPFNAFMRNCGDVFIPVALYYVHIKKWLSVVPRGKWLFVTMEELSTNKIQTLNRVWDFLSIPPLKKEVQGVVHSQVTVDYHHDHSLAMRNDTREILKRFFRPYNQMLADLLGDRKFLWESN